MNTEDPKVGDRRTTESGATELLTEAGWRVTPNRSVSGVPDPVVIEAPCSLHNRPYGVRMSGDAHNVAGG